MKLEASLGLWLFASFSSWRTILHVDAFQMIQQQRQGSTPRNNNVVAKSLMQPLHVSRSSAADSTTDADDFASFAASLEEDVAPSVTQQQQRQQRQRSFPSYSSSTTTTTTQKSWQADLERFLDPTTSVAQRQILISDLMNANADIRASVETALRDRKIDPLLTPTGRKLQDGTRAVARQLTTDIIPSLTRPVAAAASAAASSSSSNNANFPPIPPILPRPEDVSRVGNRVLNAVSNQLQKNFETFQSDLANPTRIPERIAKQTEELLQEASNIFLEKPIGLKEPVYTVVAQYPEYEIRDYEAYTVASTNMEVTSNPADQGVAFNTLASYIFGNNAENRAMDMTTPVTTTASGEMRFYVADMAPPNPLEQDASQSVYEAGSKIRIERIPAARLAVRKFTGFCTAGEIARQKEALLAAMALDSDQGVELDVPHGQTVGHVIFQYNPPYTLPVLRLNEIAVPVVVPPTSEDDDEGSATTTTTMEQAWEYPNGTLQ